MLGADGSLAARAALARVEAHGAVCGAVHRTADADIAIRCGYGDVATWVASRDLRNNSDRPGLWVRVAGSDNVSRKSDQDVSDLCPFL